MKLIDHLLVLILDYVEEQETIGPYKVSLIEGYTSDQVPCHIRMCEEAGWLHSGKWTPSPADRLGHRSRLEDIHPAITE
ncbi:MAG: hypothetical protein OXD43_05130 [Bacteroidetes bacterium]|nr:hypothetical protein [Bacteroidota bacterium]